ncbi:MAG: sulfate transporter, inner rane subunit CysT, partial [Solirubrobacterales bacterium]|nr:sulfate transporter, inner rane subunit CysT [Solirubrobacterales bacterium]
AEPAPRPTRRRRRPGRPFGLGVAVLWLSVIVLLPLAAVVAKATETNIWDAVTRPAAIDALQLTLVTSLLVALINAVLGTLTAWVLVRDDFPGKGLIDTLIDLPFALPTIVAGLTLLALYGNDSPVGIDIARTHAAIVLALLFVTLPFVVRAVQPVLMELDREMEEASASLGASNATTFRRVILPNLMPAILSGTALSFARAVGEFGSIVIVAGAQRDNQVASTYIFSLIETDNTASAAAVSVVLLVISLAILLGIRLLEQRGSRHRAH